MPRFFIDFPCAEGASAILSGENGRHAAKSLRVRPGEILTLCDGMGTDYFCRVESVEGESVTVCALRSEKSKSEPSVWVEIYQGLPKSDKMDFIVQKSVEMGASRIVPVMTERCISRPDGAAAAKKTERWQKIAEEAAKQSGRGRIPGVARLTDFASAVREASAAGPVLLFYEGGGESLSALLPQGLSRCAVFIGPEGGFAESEVSLARECHARIATLGPRILRTETAPVAALGAIMTLTGNM